MVAALGRDVGYKRGHLNRSLGAGGNWEATGNVWVVYAGIWAEMITGV
jgi:hypothetical protein